MKKFSGIGLAFVIGTLLLTTIFSQETRAVWLDTYTMHRSHSDTQKLIRPGNTDTLYQYNVTPGQRVRFLHIESNCTTLSGGNAQLWNIYVDGVVIFRWENTTIFPAKDFDINATSQIKITVQDKNPPTAYYNMYASYYSFKGDIVIQGDVADQLNTTYNGQSAAYWAYQAYLNTYNATASKSAVTYAKEASDRTWDTTSGKTAATLAREARDKTITLPTIDSNAIADAVVGKQIIKDINANTSEARNALRKRAIKVVDGGTFKEIVYDELSGSPEDGVTGASITGITATIPKVGLGITVLEGTISGTGVKVIVFGSRGIIFNVIAKPTLNAVATVTFE